MANAKKKGNKEKHLIGIDLGGTKILAAVISPKGDILATVKRATPAADSAGAGMDSMAEAAKRAMTKAGVKRRDILVVGAGAPGPLNPITGIIHFTPNLKKWKNVPLAAGLAKRLKLPAFVHNDVDAGTYGEFKVGAGKGVKDLIGLFPGTGIGGGIILDGRLRTGFRGSAGELGHLIVLADGPVCGCGNRGCVEAVASRTAITRDIRLALQSGCTSVIGELVENPQTDRITSGTLARAAEQEDALVLEVLRRAAYYLGLLTANMVNALDPERIVFGGGLIEACEPWLLPTIRDVAQQYYLNKHDMDKVKVLAAELGDYATVLGAAMLARDRLG